MSNCFGQMPISPPFSSEGREFEKSVLKPVANVLSLVSTTEGGKHIIVQFERKKSHDHEQKRKYNLLGDRMAYVN